MNAWASTVPEFPGQYLISGAWSRVPEDLHKFVLLVPEYVDSPGLPSV